MIVDAGLLRDYGEGSGDADSGRYEPRAGDWEKRHVAMAFETRNEVFQTGHARLDGGHGTENLGLDHAQIQTASE